MTPTIQTIDLNGIPIELVRKRIKRINLTVYPPDGRVRLSVPIHATDEAVRAVLADKLSWIERQRQKAQKMPGRAAPKYVSGEEHLLWGQAYPLSVVAGSGPARAALRGGQIELTVRPRSTRAERERTLQELYRAEVRAALPALIAKWEPVMGVQAAEWGVRRMKTRWGSCSIRARRLWFSLELAQRPPHSLEYVVVHELTHLLERLHNQRFYAFMTKFLPGWKTLRAELNKGSGARGEG